MKKKVKVILLEDIQSLGQAGRIVTVSEGYARNSLFPEGKAALATPDIETQRAQAQKKEAKKKTGELEALQAKAEALTGTELTLTARLKDGDDIFGSITAKDIAKALTTQTDLKVKPKDIKLSQSITKIGSQDVDVHLSDEIVATIRVSVVPEPGSEPKDEEE